MLPSLFLEMLQVSLMNWDSSFKTPPEAFPEEAAKPLPLALPSFFLYLVIALFTKTDFPDR